MSSNKINQLPARLDYASSWSAPSSLSWSDDQTCLDTAESFVNAIGENSVLNAVDGGSHFGFTKELKNIFDRRKQVTIYFESKFKLNNTHSQL